MGKIIYITESNYMPTHTLKSKKLLGLRVLSRSGEVAGKVADLELEPHSLKMLGVVVSGDYRLYVGKNYIEKISTESIILNIDPTVFLMGKKVLTYDGQLLGTVREVRRKGTTNDLKEIVVKAFMKKKHIIQAADIQSSGSTVILSRHYNGK